jgi:hypothetical protein
LSAFLAPVPRIGPRCPRTRTTCRTGWDPTPACPALLPTTKASPRSRGRASRQGALTGRTVWLSAGHGWYWSETLKRWTTQRGNNYGLVEDLSNAEAVNYYLARYLWNAGADVWLVRERGMNRHEVIVDNDQGCAGLHRDRLVGHQLHARLPGRHLPLVQHLQHAIGDGYLDPGTCPKRAGMPCGPTIATAPTGPSTPATRSITPAG